MQKLVFLLLLLTTCALSVPKPMESLEHYNVLMVHGAYGSDKGISENAEYVSAYEDTTFLENATLGDYTSNNRITNWIAKNVFEEDISERNYENVRNSYIYNWRSFTNPANSSVNNAYELGYRSWNKSGKFGRRRALFEEAQEVKAVWYDIGQDSTHFGQDALQIIRKNPDLYRQLASRYILVGHSMGGVVAREYVQGDFYNGDVDKIITLDSPHEGTGALNMQIYKEARGWTDKKVRDILLKSTASMAATGILLGVMGTDPVTVEAGICITLFSSVIAGGASIPLTRIFSTERYYGDDPLVGYVDPYRTGFGTIDSLNRRPYMADSMPMVRVLGSKNSMTFGDPTHVDYGLLGSLYLENFSLPFINLAGQLGGNGDASTVYVNAMTAGIAGIVGIPLMEQGSSLVTESSGLGKHVAVLNDRNVDVRKGQFNAAVQAEGGDGDFAASMGIVSGAVLALDFTLGLINPVAAKAAKTGIIVSFSSTMGFSVLGGVVATGFDDLAESHMMPLYRKNLEKWLGKANSYTRLSGGDTALVPYLMEDFLYERPFVNLLLGDIRTLDTLSKMDPAAREVSSLNRNCYYLGDRDSAECAVGLFSNAGDPGSSQKILRVASLSPLRFKSESDWSKMGVKVDRWERVDGLTPDGRLAKKSVPVRHVERYEVPAIAVDGWIERYSFVVDDLMPHRLRQVRMNFNYREEIAWECDMKKSPDADDACAVYKRTSGGEWTELRKEKHPVRKNGAFDFKPRDYGYDNLLSLQKDNQNTVTVSTVNKIGLSNTQRFYYLFKATDDLLVPVWPKRDVVVNEISGFEAYASVLDYQGFSVEGMRDSVWYVVGDTRKTFGRLQDMDFLRSEGSGNVYGSRISQGDLSEGEYHWVFNAVTHNSAGESNDCNDVYDVPFNVDVTPPNFELTVDEQCMNPDSSVFIARFAWGDSTTPDIRAMRWQLEKSNGNDFSLVTAMPSLYDVTSKDFAVAWDKVPNRENLQDGLYRVKALAIDYAAPGAAAYAAVSSLVSKIAGGKDSAADWEALDGYRLNRAEGSAEFRIDRTAPALSFDSVGGAAAESAVSAKYAALSRPARDAGSRYVSGDSLLRVGYAVEEPLGGRDSASVTVAWMFVHAGDTAKADRAGDSVWVKGADGTWRDAWTEMSGMRLADGDYLLRATARDEAKNAKSYGYGKRIRIDRTAPKILGLVSSRLVYPDSAKSFGATLMVSERDDALSNRTGMRCHYRVLGGDADGLFRDVAERILSDDTLRFEIPAGAVGTENGKRYLEAVCIDAAGNAGVRTDLFHVGDRYPTIVSPASDDEYLQSEYVPIVGIAPPPSAGAENSTVYRLRYRMDGSDEWLSERIAVVSPNRSRDSANISRTSQSAEGVLGYLHNVGFSESKVWIELSTRSCADCDWRSDSVLVTLDGFAGEDSSRSVVLSLSPSALEVGRDSLDVSLRLAGSFDGDYFLRVHAEDSKGAGIFDRTSERAFASPFNGESFDTTAERGVWFYERDGLYHLRWKGLSAADSIAVSYDSKGFGDACLAFDGRGNASKGCSVRSGMLNASPVFSQVDASLSAYPVWKPLSVADSVMLLFGESGHVAMRTSKAFHVGLSNLAGDESLPVYFGASSESGFAFMGAEISSAVNPWTTGWTVSPEAYELHFVWDGTTSTKSYPAEGSATLHIEVVQNTTANPQVILKDTTVFLTLPEMEISLPEIPEFYIVESASDTATSDLGEKMLYTLGSLNIPYGILYRDAWVTARITDSKGNLVKRLLDSAYTRASSNRTAYSVLWDATDSAGIPVKPGTYRAVLSASEAGEKGREKSRSASFDVSLRKMLRDSSNAVNLVVAEAFDDEGKHRYVPVPDYLVRADIAAKYLPREKRQGVSLDMDVSGTQKIYGYAPERFSLAIKRHRERLDLVVLRRLHTNIEYIDCGSMWGMFGCSEKGNRSLEKIYTDTLTFLSGVRSRTLNVHKLANEDDHDFGYDDDRYADNFLDMVVFTMSGWNQFLSDQNIDSVNSKERFEKALSSPFHVWSLSKVTSNSQGFSLPLPDAKEQNYLYPQNRLDENCRVQLEENLPKKFCTYGDSGTTEGYNPNANLFTIKMNGKENGNFYSVKEALNSHAPNRERYRYVYFDIVLTIPDSYWDAPFGMDNLVNRTIRFDHANKTVFGTGSDGYWAALSGSCGTSFLGSYFDGTDWKCDKSYGLLTPYEMQYLPFLPANVLSGGKNIFLFADENPSYMYPSYFDMKFYGPKNPDDYFQVLALGTALESSSACDYSATTNFDAAYGNALRCQVSLTSLGDSVRTPLFAHGSAAFFVGRNKVWNTGHPVEVSFPNDSSWRSEVATSGKPCGDPVGYVNGSADCYKYYEGGSKLHHYLHDFTDADWLNLYTENGFIRNVVNSPARAPIPTWFYFRDSTGASHAALSNLPLRPKSADYENGYFYIPLDTVSKIRNAPTFDGITLSMFDLRLGDSAYGTFSEDSTKLLVPAKDTLVKSRIYRESADSVRRVPSRMKSASLPMKYFFRNFNSWMKEPRADSVSLLHLDSSEHSHFTVFGDRDGKDRMIRFKAAKDIRVARPKELVELSANLKSGEKYRLSYLKGGVYYTVMDTVAERSGFQRLAWFDVNRLQGNTQFLLTWGEGGNLYYSDYDLYVGSAVETEKESSVRSLFGDLSVSFPANALEERKDVTVRTAEVDDYPFEVFGDLPLTGPVMEVLPSMEFEDSTKLPRIQMRISRAEMDARNVTPQTIRLYKIDFEKKKFVPLEHALYGYLKADGNAAVSGASAETATCGAWDSDGCYPGKGKWEYLLISAETRTFSVFAALPSAFADIPETGIEVLPEVARVSERTLNIRGTAEFNLYVDDDSLWNDKGDRTPAERLDYSLDEKGVAHVKLPRRSLGTDTAYVFLVPLSDAGAEGKKSELPAASAVARALTVPAEFACELPKDSLWLGLDNGYMSYGVSCNHPGSGRISLYADGRLEAELSAKNSDTLVYDGAKRSGNGSLGKIAGGVYESRFWGRSVLGDEIQTAGPLVYTDSALPVVEGWDVRDSSDVLERIFAVKARVRDAESGVSLAKLSASFGGVPLENLTLLPDSSGNVSASVRLSRELLSECVGCRLSLNLHVEDFGHNSSERIFASEPLYPYPTGLALWYPAREGSGNVAYEFSETGHHLDLSPVNSPWLSDAGIYLGKSSDMARGAGNVDLGSATSYTWEARIKRGHSAEQWNELVSFEGTGGLSIRLFQKGRTLRLSEGKNSWLSGEVLPVEKSWAHVAVAVDSASVRFYVDGELARFVPGGIVAERELYGVFALGGTPSFIGNVADIRFYTKALSEAEIAALSLAVSEDGEESEVILAKDLTIGRGFSPEFSCAVAGNRYFVSHAEKSRLSFSVSVSRAENYRPVVYARSANRSAANVLLGEGSVRLSGNLSLSGVWRAVSLEGVSISLSAGLHELSLEFPENVEVGGIALVSGDVSASMIAWGNFDKDLEMDAGTKVKASVRYEGFPDRSMLRPRIRLANVSGRKIEGYSVRYYFRGEDPLSVKAQAFYPQDGSALSVHAESARTGYAEWDFGGEVLLPRDSAFGGQGPHFGLFNSDWSPWNAEDDPSFAVDGATGFAADRGIVVLDADRNFVGGSCAEMEDEISALPKVRTVSSDVRNDRLASEIHIAVENLGNVALKNFDLQYYFYVEDGLSPVLDVNHLGTCLSAELESFGAGRYAVNIHCANPIGAGGKTALPVNFTLHLPGWASAWNADDDPSHVGLGAGEVEARGIGIFDSLGNRIYGEIPVWPETLSVAETKARSPSEPSEVFEKNAVDENFQIARSPDGFLLSLKGAATLSLDLVNAIGLPVKSIFRGSLPAGEKFLPVDWTGIDLSATYLVLRVDGNIKTTRLSDVKEN